MTVVLHPPHGNRRRSYGIQFFIGGVPVTAPTTVQTGDTITWRYLGGNVAQSTDGGAAWDALRAAGMDTRGNSGTFTLPKDDKPAS
jgi:hypothetical protein